jgi:hypothetical protein
MKGSVKALFFLTLLLGWGAPTTLLSFTTHNTTPFKASVTIPRASMDLSDLDVRDEYNRPVKSQAAVAEMTNLFVTGLNTLLMFNLTPSAIFMRDLMAQSWNVFSGFFTQTLARSFEKIEAWLHGKKIQLAKSFLTSSLLSFPSESKFMGRHSYQCNFQFLVSSILSSTQILR